MIPLWVFVIGIVAAWFNGAMIGFLYRVRQERRSGYRIAKDRFEEQRERVDKSLAKARERNE